MRHHCRLGPHQIQWFFGNAANGSVQRQRGLAEPGTLRRQYAPAGRCNAWLAKNPFAKVIHRTMPFVGLFPFFPQIK
jgi:hypothetical protein